MKIKPILFSLLLSPLLCTGVCAQEETKNYSLINMDSLRLAVAAMTDDHQRFEQVDAFTFEMEDLHWRNWGLGPLLSYRDSLAALVQTPEERLPSEIAAAYYYMNTEYYDHCLKHLQGLEGQLDIYQSVKSHADIYQAFGEMYREMGLPEKALPYCALSEENYAAAGADQAGGYPRGLLDYGKALFALGRSGEAVQKINRAKELFDLQEDTEGAIWALTDLSTIFSKLRLYDEVERVLREEESYDFPEAALLSMYNARKRGYNRLEAKRYLAAKNAFRQAIKLSEELDLDDYDYINNLRGMVRSLYHLNEFDSLRYYAGLAHQIYQQQDRKPGLAQGNFRALKVYEDLANANYPSAAAAAQTIHAEALAQKNDQTVESSLALLSLVYDKMGDATEALKYTKQYLTVRDSIQSANKASALLLYRTQFETEEKIREIERIDAERNLAQTQSRQYGIAALILLGLLALGMFLFMQLRRVRKKLELQNLELADLNKTKDRFFSIVAHDLRNPINALSGVNEQLARDIAQKNEANLIHTTGLVSATTGQLKTMLDNLLTWSLNQGDKLRQQPATLDLEFLIGESLAVQASSASAKGLRLLNNCPPGVQLFADEKAVKIVLRNLLSNAIKYTPQGGEVSITVRQNEGQTTLQVKDNGVGMSSERLSTIFNLAKKEDWGTAGESGTGLGLILVKELVEANGGSIQVKSKPGAGTVVVVDMGQSPKH